jgi:AbrB family looped-hinge helix DNA binding protein
MAVTKIGPKHQVTIPKEIFKRLKLEVGDFLDAQGEDGKIVLVPERLTEKTPIPPLSPKEEKLLKKAGDKIERIKQDILSSQGLTDEEVRVAVKVGLINKGQAWWWTEEWQKGERKAEQEIRQGKVSQPFETAAELLKSLRSG